MCNFVDLLILVLFVVGRKWVSRVLFERDLVVTLDDDLTEWDVRGCESDNIPNSNKQNSLPNLVSDPSWHTGA